MAYVQDLWSREGASKSGKRWLARWTDPDGKRRSQAFTTKDLAKKHIALVTVQQQQGTYVPPNATTVGDLWPRWWVARAELAASTREGYEAAWKTYVKPRWVDTPIRNVTRAAVREWLPTLRTKRGSELSASWARKVSIVLSSLLDLAVEDRLLHSNPLAKLGKDLPQQQPSDRRYLTVAEVDKLYEAMAPHDLEVRVLVMTGIRRGEMAGLRVGDLDVARRRLRVSRDVDAAGVFDSTKSRRHRDVPVGGELLELLVKRAQGKARNELLLPSPSGAPWVRDSWRPRWETARAKAGLGDLDSHELRHTAASLAIHAGANVKTVQRMLGHASASMTLDVYGHLWDDELDTLPVAMDAHMTSERERISREASSKQVTNTDRSDVA